MRQRYSIRTTTVLLILTSNLLANIIVHKVQKIVLVIDADAFYLVKKVYCKPNNTKTI